MSLSASFAGKRVIVTGGGKGIGRAVIEKLYSDGAIIFTVDKDQELLQKLKIDFPNVTTFCVDLSDWSSTRKAIESFGPVDHLVNNAAIVIMKELLDVTEQAVDNVFNVNFKALINITQVVAKGMIDNKISGSIVNLSSVGSKLTHKGFGMYACSKAAVSMLTKSFALELGPGIRVNAVCPAGVNTDMLKNCITPAASAQLDRAVFKRLIEPSEVADTILFLLSPLSAIITGEQIFIDGGLTTN